MTAKVKLELSGLVLLDGEFEDAVVVALLNAAGDLKREAKGEAVAATRAPLTKRETLEALALDDKPVSTFMRGGRERAVYDSLEYWPDGTLDFEASMKLHKLSVADLTLVPAPEGTALSQLRRSAGQYVRHGGGPTRPLPLVQRDSADNVVALTHLREDTAMTRNRLGGVRGFFQSLVYKKSPRGQSAIDIDATLAKYNLTRDDVITGSAPRAPAGTALGSLRLAIGLEHKQTRSAGNGHDAPGGWAA